MHLRLAFTRTVEAFPDAVGIVDGTLRLSYLEWHHRIVQTAAALRGMGVRPGDRILVQAPNSWRHATIFWAAQYLGAVSVHVNPKLKPDEFSYYLDDAEPRVVIQSAASVPGAVPIDSDALLGDRQSAIALDGCPDGEDLLSHMVYTSGTTGPPKGVPLTHRQSYERTLALALHMGIYAGDRVLGVMPMFHTMGVIGSVVPAAVLGATYHAMERFEPGAALELIERERITAFFGSPTHYALMSTDPSIERRDLGRFAKTAYGGGIMAPEQIAFWRKRTGTAITQIYGTTETMCTLVTRRTGEKPGSAGQPGLHHRVRLVRIGDRDPSALVPDGEEGELLIQVRDDGAQHECFSQYWRKPEQFEASVVDGWYFTGDTARRDSDGDYWITGRAKNIIRSAGEFIHPEEVERILSGHSAVADVAVIGIPDPVWGEVVSALIVARAEVTEDDIDGFCRDHPQLASHKRPRRIRFVSEIPRNVSGKLIRDQGIALLTH